MRNTTCDENHCLLYYKLSIYQNSRHLMCRWMPKWKSWVSSSYRAAKRRGSLVIYFPFYSCNLLDGKGAGSLDNPSCLYSLLNLSSMTLPLLL